jgi:hypothetical protein
LHGEKGEEWRVMELYGGSRLEFLFTLTKDQRSNKPTRRKAGCRGLAVFAGDKGGVAKGLHAGSPEAGLNGKRISDTVPSGMYFSFYFSIPQKLIRYYFAAPGDDGA